ncbi:DUF805 domain-containing protein [Alteromonadaceae bacterium M269]|nr:DUF805 domain-containing protein [Alteromonadaceae bacterium M269]
MSENAYSSPESELLNPNAQIATYTISEILFSFQGRIRRKTYWLSILSLTLGYGIFIFLVAFIGALIGLTEAVLSVVTMVLYIPLFWASLAIAAKRWHDRNKSAWWILIGIIPIIGAIWAFVENGFLQGDIESNNYGLPNK